MSSNEKLRLSESRRDVLADEEKLRQDFDQLKSRLSKRYSELSFDDYLAASAERGEYYEPDDLLNYNYVPPESRSRPSSPTLLRDGIIWLLKGFGAVAMLLTVAVLSVKLAGHLGLGGWGAFLLFLILWFGGFYTLMRIFRIASN